MNTDFLVIGGGILGISIAREIKRRHSDASITLIEKEPSCGLHASSRNSGVLHAGFYYTKDSLKAKFTREGNQRLTEYCQIKQLQLRRCGKLVVAKDASELTVMDELLRRGRVNQVPLDEVTEKQAKSIEPHARTFQKALFSPTTSTIHPGQLMQSLKDDALKEGIDIREGVSYLSKGKNVIRTNHGNFFSGFVINAAGLYADKIAKDFGFSQEYQVLPFKGLYLYSAETPTPLRTCIYPVPNIANPFLGVHFTVTVDGKAKVGPTAIPALWREQYQGWKNFKLNEFLEILQREVGLFLSSDFDFKKLAIEEIKKLSAKHLLQLASGLVQDFPLTHYKVWGQPGIRAQLMNRKTRRLEMDFVIEGNERSIHVLNAVSPGLTCSMPFAEYVCDQMQVVYS